MSGGTVRHSVRRQPRLAIYGDPSVARQKNMLGDLPPPPEYETIGKPLPAKHRVLRRKCSKDGLAWREIRSYRARKQHT